MLLNAAKYQGTSFTVPELLKENQHWLGNGRGGGGGGARVKRDTTYPEAYLKLCQPSKT